MLIPCRVCFMFYAHEIEYMSIVKFPLGYESCYMNGIGLYLRNDTVFDSTSFLDLL
jgi:hypothetical protein